MNKSEKTNHKIMVAMLKVDETLFLKFTGMDDIKELIGFTGIKPRVTEEGKLQLRKWLLETPCFVERDSTMKVVNVLAESEYNSLYSTVDTKEYSKSFQALKEK